MFVAISTVAENGSAGGRTQENYGVNVEATSEADIDPTLLREGENSASSIFAGIHVRLTWTDQLPSHSPQPTRCGSETPTGHLLLQIVPHAPANVSHVALAMAMPYADSGVRVIVFYDRVDLLLGGKFAPQGRILGYVLAHEIAHVLQGILRHSETGVMRARWTATDLRLMGIGALQFAKEDVQLIWRRFDHLPTSAGCSGFPEGIMQER